jgi:uncharacterized phage protein (TIGR02220 family)
MARPYKTGLEYFPHDVDLSHDEKIEAIEALYGNDGYAMYCKLLERIYRNGGKLFISDAETMLILSRKCNISTIDLFKTMLNTMVKVGLFDENIFKATKALTSNGILKRVQMVENKREKNKQYYLSRVSVAETVAESTQSKVKESKVNTYRPLCQEVLDYFCLKTGKKFLLTKDRGAVISQCLKEGRTLEDFKKAVDNFCQDDWPEREKFMDIVYVFGVRNKINNFDKWLNFTPKEQVRAGF